MTPTRLLVDRVFFIDDACISVPDWGPRAEPFNKV